MQHFDGTIEESEPEGWIAMRVEPAEAPEDWSGSVDINPEDLADQYSPLLLDWQSRVDMLDEFD
jgi:hypothetical protein